MGVLRTLLAIAVIASHAGAIIPGVQMVSGDAAVEAFYVISGFYMALILTERYSDQPAHFFMARALRIYPMYWIVLAIATAGRVFYHHPVDLPPLTATSVLLVGGSNLFLFGRDVFQFLGFDSAGATVLDLARVDASRTANVFPVPQAWTLALEVTFYLFAPVLAKLRTRWLLAIFIASFGCREVGLYFFFDQWGQWSYYLLPLQICFFVVGMLSYRAYRLIGQVPPALGATAIAVMAAITFMGSVPRISTLLFVALPIALPAIFSFSRKSRLDDAIGQLSYPLYLIHLAVIEFVTGPDGALALAVSVVASIALIGITRPIEKIRVQLRKPPPSQARFSAAN